MAQLVAATIDGKHKLQICRKQRHYFPVQVELFFTSATKSYLHKMNIYHLQQVVLLFFLKNTFF